MEGLSVLALLVVWALDIVACMPSVSEISCHPLPSPPLLGIRCPLRSFVPSTSKYPPAKAALDLACPGTGPLLSEPRGSFSVAVWCLRSLLAVVAAHPAHRAGTTGHWAQSCVSILACSMNHALQAV
jgi:hypothetical protein